MAKPLEPRRNVSRGAAAQVKTSLPRDLVEEIRRSTKPTQAENAISRLSRAVELLERGDSRGAAAEAAKAKELSPRSPAVREVLGMALYGEERWQDAHSIKLIHRDLKPENVLVGKRPDGTEVAKLCDFGIAKLAQEEGPKLSQAGSMIGTPLYMSPEAAMGRDTDARSDLYPSTAALRARPARDPRSPGRGRPAGGACRHRSSGPGP